MMNNFNLCFEFKSYRWKQCVGKVSKSMHMSLAGLYVRKFFDEEAKEKVKKMVDYEQNQLRNIIKNVRLFVGTKNI